MASEEKDIRKGFARFTEKLASVVEDLATLEVTTYTGDLTITGSQLLSKDGASPKFNTKAVLEQVAQKGDMTFKLVGYTYLAIDSDAINFVKENLTEQEHGMMEAHKTMVLAAQESRMATLNLIRSLF